MTVGLGMSDFAGLRSGGILDASRWHDRPITKTHLCKSELTFHYVLHALVSLVAFLLVGNAKPRKRGGAGRGAARLTHTSLVAVSRTRGNWGWHE